MIGVEKISAIRSLGRSGESVAGIVVCTGFRNKTILFICFCSFLQSVLTHNISSGVDEGVPEVHVAVKAGIRFLFV